MRVAFLPIFLFLLAIYPPPIASKTPYRRKRCLSKELKNIISGVIDEVSTSPEFESSLETSGVIANILKRRVQLRSSRVYEIIVSRKNFALASYGVGNQFCKLFRQGIYALAYETPHQSGYHVRDLSVEAEFSSISDLDPMGTANTQLSGQVKAMGVELETDGYRLGFPKGSHCDEEMRGGYICCHHELFQSMHNTVLNMEEDDSYFSVDRRVIAQRIRREAEIAINQPLELVVSPRDFEVVSNHHGDCVCKFQAGENIIMAWRTPGNWSIGVDLFADNGRSDFRGCDRTERHTHRQRMKRNACCNQTLQYTMTRNLEMAVGRLDGSEVDVNEVSRYLARSSQKQLDSHVETIVSRGDFVYRSMNPNLADSEACKLDLLQFHVLMFESPGKPLDTEFLTGDVEPSNSAEANAPSPSQNTAGGQQNAPSSGQNGGQGGEQNAPAQNQAPNAQPSNQPAQVPQQNAPQAAQQASPQQAPSQQAPQASAQQAAAQQAFPQQVQAPQAGGQQAFAPQSFGGQSAGADAFAVLYQPYQCFSEDTWVITETGRKNMSELEIGDFVMTANSKKSFFVPVILWLHKNEEVDSGFVEVRTITERRLHISPRHFIYRANCNTDDPYMNYDENGVLLLPKSGEIYAQELIEGDCLYVYEEEKWQLEEVVSVKMKKKRGLYAPLTDNGKIVVNGILASCFTDVREPIIQNVYFEFISKIRKHLTRLLGWDRDGQVGVPGFLHVFEDLLEISLPYARF